MKVNFEEDAHNVPFHLFGDFCAFQNLSYCFVAVALSLFSRLQVVKLPYHFFVFRPWRGVAAQDGWKGPWPLLSE